MLHSNPLQAIVADLKKKGVTLTFIPNGNDLFHFKVELNKQGVVTIFNNIYPIDKLQYYMKSAYIHFHKKFCFETRDYKLADKTELPPETYFINAEEFGVYPPSGRLYLGFTKPWFYSVNQVRNLSSWLVDIRNAEVLGHLSGWFQIHSENERKQFRQELEELLTQSDRSYGNMQNGNTNG